MSGDFRSKRVKLPPEAFAISYGADGPPRDLIPKRTWKSMMSLPDDISLRTSDYYGSRLQELWNLWGNWISIVSALQQRVPASSSGPIVHVALDATDYFQGAVHNALVGYYRLAFASLRAAIENLVVGLQFELADDRSQFEDWLSGAEFGLGWAADHVVSHVIVRDLEQALKAAIGDDLFHQRRPTVGDQGGLVRRWFRNLSRYAHGAPDHNDADIWQSNGPIFVPDAFDRWMQAFLVTYAVGVLVCYLARPDLDAADCGASLGLPDLFAHVVGQLRSGVDGSVLLKHLLTTCWNQ